MQIDSGASSGSSMGVAYVMDGHANPSRIPAPMFGLISRNAAHGVVSGSPGTANTG